MTSAKAIMLLARIVARATMSRRKLIKDQDKTMTTLETHIIENKLDETKAMNVLQDRGIISDNCIDVKDVAEADCERAIAVLEKVMPT
jgi:hypothetical protein